MTGTPPTWEEDCKRWRGMVLTGRFAHWCNDWDGLPVDETTDEFMCCGCEWTPPEEREAFEAAREACRVRHNAEYRVKVEACKDGKECDGCENCWPISDLLPWGSIEDASKTQKKDL